ncbi:helix-turn-helix domain-containing protein [Nocardia sp. JMUB6875]|uniref:winged helix-turn-helix transcriptional regulator n=1 Tax=Nocardia sp. JMUB6875 TaxID=3158170 RepID=UPI0032E5A923
MLQRDCSVFRAVTVIGDAWSWMVLREALIHDVRRFDGFQQRLGIARSTLTLRLERLVAAHILERQGPEYLPTRRGADFLGCLLAALHFGDTWCTEDGGPPPVEVIHRECGQRMHAVLACDSCHRAVLAREVRFDRRPEPVRRPQGSVGRQRMPGLDLLERNGPDSIARTMQVVGDMWSSLIIQESFFGTHRFDDFHRRLGIATNILSHRLSRLVELGILTQADGYHLTEKGLALCPVPLAMLTWGDRWLSDGAPPITLSHVPCGQPFAALLTCSACRREVDRGDLSIALSSSLAR